YSVITLAPATRETDPVARTTASGTNQRTVRRPRHLALDLVIRRPQLLSVREPVADLPGGDRCVCQLDRRPRRLREIEGVEVIVGFGVARRERRESEDPLAERLHRELHPSD